MSRGPGKWQRLILQRVEADGWCVVYDLLPDNRTRAQESAINRAAHLLADRGLVDTQHRDRETETNRQHYWGKGRAHPACLVAVKPGYDAPFERSVWLGKGHDSFNRWIPADLHWEFHRGERDKQEMLAEIDQRPDLLTPAESAEVKRERLAELEEQIRGMV